MAYEPELEKLERRYQDDPARNFAQLAERYRKDGRLEDALNLLLMHLAERPNYVSGLVVLGRCQLDQHNDAEARETFERVLAVDAEHIIALRALGEIAERAGDVTSAKAWFGRLLEVDPMNEEAAGAVQRLAPAPVAPLVETPPETEAASPPAEAGAADILGFGPPPAEVIEAAGAFDSHEPGARTAEFLGERASAFGEAPREREFVIEQADDAFMPSAEAAMPADVEPVGDIQFTSQLPEEESPLGDAVGAAAEPESAIGMPAGEGPSEPGLPADAAPLAVEAFDESLGWGAGERVSRRLTAEDIAAAEREHEEGLAAAYSGLPGLEETVAPTVEAGRETPPVEGLQGLEAPPTVAPLEGYEPTEAAAAEAAGGIPADALGVVSEEIIPVVPEVSATAETAEMGISATGETMDRETTERRASLFGLPMIPVESAATPLVLEPEPEPVVTETMADLYVRQGLLGEAREVYGKLLASSPGDRRLQAKLAELDARALPQQAGAVVQYAASASGGQSARAFLSAVLAERPRGLVGAAETPAQMPGVQAPEPMEQAFGSEVVAEAPGAPTQPAADEVSLAAIFGEAPPSHPAPKAATAPTPPARAAGGFSFDEFFGKPATARPSTDRKPRDTLADDEGDEAFRDWLKSLKS